MLNELALLKNGIEAVDKQALVPIHKKIYEPGKTNLVRVVLGEQKIIELDVLEGTRNKNYWTQGDGNKNQFPAVKLPFPIRPGGAVEFREWKKEHKNPSPDKLMECLEGLRAENPVDITQHKHWPLYRQELVNRAEIYSRLQGDSLTIHRLIKTYLSFGEDGLSLLRKFDEALWAECQNQEEPRVLKILALAMFGDGQKLDDNGRINGNRITLLLDIQDDGAGSAAQCHWVPKLSNLLFQEEATSDNVNIGTCAISGLPDTKLVADTFPEPKCEVLGKVIIFSRKKGIHTYKRYGKLAAESYPLSKNLADGFSSALRYLTNKDQGTTWDKLPAENGGSDLLIAFCREFVDANTARVDANTARLVAYESGQDDFFNESDYEEESKQICESFKGKGIDLETEPRVDFLILRKISDGVKKVVFSSSHPVSQLDKSSASWNSACKNTPPITLTVFKKGDNKPKNCPPKPISPKEFAFLLRKNYTRSIDKKQKTVPGSAFADVMALFFDDARTPELAARLLQKLLKQFTNLLEKIALEKRKPIDKATKTTKHHFEALRAVTAMSLLLNKLDRQNEVYMKELAYKLGQFCAALDEIHIGYCVSKRDGKIPNRLIGNQAYAAAVVNPQKALAITAQRFAVYKSWASKNRLKEDDKLKKEEKNAKYAYFWLQKNSVEIHQLIPATVPRPTPESKAELLLGYLAGRPIVKKQNVNDS